MSGVDEYVTSILAIRKYASMFQEDTECWYHSWGYLDEKHEMFSGNCDSVFDWPNKSRISESKVTLVARDIFSAYVALGASDQLLLPTDLTLRTAKRLECIGLYGPEVFMECKNRIFLALRRDIFPRFLRSAQHKAMLAMQSLTTTLPSPHQAPHRLHFFHASASNIPLALGGQATSASLHLPVIDTHGNGHGQATEKLHLGRRLESAPVATSTTASFSMRRSSNTSLPSALLAQSRRFSFEEILQSRILYDKFLAFLEKRYCSENLHCYMTICRFESLTTAIPLKRKPPSASSSAAATYFHQNTGEAYETCRSMYIYFIAQGSVFEINMHSDDRDDILLSLASPHRNMFAQIKKMLQTTLQFEFLSYKKTPEYHQLGAFLQAHEEAEHYRRCSDNNIRFFRLCVPLFSNSSSPQARK
jgi:hypothetical protein